MPKCQAKKLISFVNLKRPKCQAKKLISFVNLKWPECQGKMLLNFENWLSYGQYTLTLTLTGYPMGSIP